jgi:hypothetical protein
VPALSGVLVVFGGVGEDEWLRDVHVLELAYTGGAGARGRGWGDLPVEPR